MRASLSPRGVEPRPAHALAYSVETRRANTPKRVSRVIERLVAR
jgi:hypothetical protein